MWKPGWAARAMPLKLQQACMQGVHAATVDCEGCNQWMLLTCTGMRTFLSAAAVALLPGARSSLPCRQHSHLPTEKQFT